MKCLVSGATGFIGRSLCRRLSADGHELLALSKSGAALPDATPTLALDLSTRQPDPGQLQGVEVVFHLAGIAHQHAQESAYRELNELATIELARSARAAGVRCFVFLSSVKAMGPATTAAARTEDDCVAPTDPYGLSKWRAECALRAEFSDGPMAVVILRPALVYGPLAKGNLALLARAARLGLPRPPDLGGRSMIALADLVDVLCQVAGAPQQGVQTWIVADGQTYTTRFIYDHLRRAAGKPEGKGWLPTAGWRLAAAVLDRVSASGGESTYDKLFGAELYSAAALMAATGWRPHTAFEQVASSLMQPAGGQG